MSFGGFPLSIFDKIRCRNEEMRIPLKGFNGARALHNRLADLAHCPEAFGEWYFRGDLLDNLFQKDWAKKGKPRPRSGGRRARFGAMLENVIRVGCPLTGPCGRIANRKKKGQQSYPSIGL
ncbi:MAG: hypothetical protein A2516_09325 [Alphaproteobacteria bacterium RIFOXYD12_FULL_60_8]|nr:MAG: hypothetical protein A2516_09325 [Alphaproteobacteria bacterium RIFOXYD12_FULL_60_8]